LKGLQCRDDALAGVKKPQNILENFMHVLRRRVSSLSGCFVTARALMCVTFASIYGFGREHQKMFHVRRISYSGVLQSEKKIGWLMRPVHPSR
jgi:hypothetical protein